MVRPLTFRRCANRSEVLTLSADKVRRLAGLFLSGHRLCSAHKRPPHGPGQYVRQALIRADASGRPRCPGQMRERSERPGVMVVRPDLRDTGGDAANPVAPRPWGGGRRGPALTGRHGWPPMHHYAQVSGHMFDHSPPAAYRKARMVTNHRKRSDAPSALRHTG